MVRQTLNSSLFIIIFCLAQTAFARLPQATRSETAASCTTVSPSPGVRVSLEEGVESCKSEMKFWDCEGLAKSSPVVAAHLRKCDPESVCHYDYGSARLESYSNGYLRGAFAGVEGLAHLLWDALYGEPKALIEISRKCDLVPACKHVVADQVPWRKGSSDKDLASTSSMQLQAEALVARGLDKLKAAASTAGHYICHPSEAIPTEEQAAKNRAMVADKLRAFRSWVWENGVKLGARKLRCVDKDGLAEYQAYCIGLAADPLILLGSFRGTAVSTDVLGSQAQGLSADAVRAGGDLASQGAAETTSDTADRRLGRFKKAVSREEPRTPSRGSFIEENLNYSPASPEMNEAFVKLAERETGQSSTRFFDVENSLIKPLNDKTNDKNLVTSMTNYHKRLLVDELKELEKRNPGLSITMYSDFKSVRFAASGEVPRDIDHQVQELLKKVNQSFAERIKTADLIRHSDPEFKTPERWFRAGTGTTADQANLSARLAREQKASNQMLNFDSPQLQADVSRRLVRVDTLRADVTRALKGTPLLETISGTNKSTLNREAFDLTRKYPAAEDLRDAIRKRYGKPGFSTEQAQKMLGYAKATDEFSPGIHVIKREIVNLDGAVHGGFSADFLGLGSSNQRGTAEALARATNLKDALLQTRGAEREVTAEFKSRLKRFQEIAGDYVRCSGDDCVGAATHPLSMDEKR